MVVSSRSSRGRRAVQTTTSPEQHDPTRSASSSPQSNTRSHNASIASPEHDDGSSSRSKRARMTSLSEHESIQKRRKLGRDSDLPEVHIPLRGRTGLDSTLHQSQQGDVTRHTRNAPPLVKHDSSISNSPLNSPAYRPQYDQFKRIEEKAQKVVKKNLHNDASKEDKRTLRSEHGSTRSKTELAQYFPAFDDMLSLDPADPDLLVAKTPIVLLNDAPSFEPIPSQTDFFRSGNPPYEARVIQLEQHPALSADVEDPLSDSVYLKAHQKAERHEKQMKNGDKERAQHEKYQLERLLEELRGPDWLKTLGISGITDTEKKRYEVKRALFIRETKALIDKFRRWKEEEKRRKSERQQRALEEIEASHLLDSNNDSMSVSARKPRPRMHIARNKDHTRMNNHAASISDDEAPDPHDLDDLASQQLLDEAKLATMKGRKVNAQLSQTSMVTEPVASKPFTSFFEKQHIRDSVMSGRNRGRKSYAFGIEIPDLPEQDFELPDGILTDDTIRASQRMRRRARRGLED